MSIKWMSKKQLLGLVCLLGLGFSSISYAGDDASGTIPRKVDLSKTFNRYQLTQADKQWAASLVKNFDYQSDVMFFVQTDLPMESDGCQLQGKIYQSLQDAELFYVAEGDTMLKIGEKHPFSPAVGGFSMHAPDSKHFIACLNCLSGGVLLRNSSPVEKGMVAWHGRDWNRLDKKTKE